MKNRKHHHIGMRLLSKPNAKQIRLYRMGLVDRYGSPELLGLGMLASTTSGCLYDDLGRGPAITLYVNAISGYIPYHPELIYAELDKAYSVAGEPMPKPIQLLSKDKDCLRCFLTAFLENWREYLCKDGLLEAGT